MGRILVLAFLSILSVSSYGQHFTEKILNFHSDIYVEENTDVVVRESITVYAKGIDIRHGIYRELPTSYDYKGGNYHVDIEVASLTKDGEEEPYHTEWLSNGLRLYAGSEDVLLEEGEYTYELIYKVHHVLKYFKSFDELAWNVNGTAWKFAIDEVSATVYYPKGAKLVQYAAYTGRMGESGHDYTSEEIEGGVSFTASRVFGAGENMTVSIAWDKGHLIYPNKSEEFWYWVKTYILWIIGGLGILFGLLFNFRTWWKYGRDPKPGTIIPLFYPPKGLSPAECAYLNNNGRKTNTMFGAQLISLAVKGYVKIDVDEGKGWGKKTTYTIHQETAREKQELLLLEDSFYHKLMGSSSTLSITKGTYNPKVKSAHDNLISAIDGSQKGKYYVRNAHLKLRQFIFPFLTGIAGGFAVYLYGGMFPVIIAAVVIQIAVNAVFTRLYEQPTKEGRKVMDEIAGFIMYMKYADRERIRMMNPPTMNFHHFEENLPYAIALGVAEEWAGQFDPVELKDFNEGHMPYYQGAMIASMSDFSSNLSSTVASASTPPSSSGSSSGGGGFSGGGGGGGGGGGW